ncbi:MAG: hypothetical protein AAF639_42765 [Chloroflexota bacterium]
MNTNIITKAIVTLLTIYYVYVPASADIGHSHLLNPAWAPHSRVHLVWFLVFTATTGIIALYLLWFKNETTIAALIGLGFNTGFLVAYLTASSYGGSLSDSVGEASSGIPINLLENGVMWLIFLAIIGYQVMIGSKRAMKPHPSAI